MIHDIKVDNYKVINWSNSDTYDKMFQRDWWGVEWVYLKNINMYNFMVVNFNEVIPGVLKYIERHRGSVSNSFDFKNVVHEIDASARHLVLFNKNLYKGQNLVIKACDYDINIEIFDENTNKKTELVILKNTQVDLSDMINRHFDFIDNSTVMSVENSHIKHSLLNAKTVEIMNKYKIELQGNLKPLCDAYKGIEYNFDRLYCLVKERPKILNLIEYSEYKYFVMPYDINNNRNQFVTFNGIDTMIWFMEKWPKIKEFTPLYDSRFIDECMWLYEDGKRSDKTNNVCSDDRINERREAIKKLFCNGKFNYKELYNNTPDEFCIFIKSGDKYIFNKKFGLFDIDNKLYDRIRPYYEGVEITDEIYAKFVNIAILEEIFISLGCFKGVKLYDRYDCGSYQYGYMYNNWNNAADKSLIFVFRNSYGIFKNSYNMLNPNGNISGEILYGNDIFKRRLFDGGCIDGEMGGFIDMRLLDESMWIIGDYDERSDRKFLSLPDRLIDFRHAKRIEFKVDNTEKNSMDKDNGNFDNIDTNDQNRGLYDKFKNNKKMVLFVIIILGYVLYISVKYINDNKVVETEGFHVIDNETEKFHVIDDEIEKFHVIDDEIEKFHVIDDE
jgi:hypothetical protein